jgi:hypothetical protein
MLLNFHETLPFFYNLHKVVYSPSTAHFPHALWLRLCLRVLVPVLHLEANISKWNADMFIPRKHTTTSIATNPAANRSL